MTPPTTTAETSCVPEEFNPSSTARHPTLPTCFPDAQTPGPRSDHHQVDTTTSTGERR
ncbi:hypothetical protein [Nocardia callitridis]|uniref:hypothetical protein n=1 Tax=Nocardia callitridis TaxID=648753 RepID=UPI0031E77730